MGAQTTEATRATTRPHVRRWRTIGVSPTSWAFVGSLLLAALFGWRTLLHLRAGIVGGRADGYENLWNDWWLRTSLLHLHRSPFFSTWIEYPTGSSLRFHTFNPLGGLIALPLAPLVGDITALNLKLLFALAFGLFCTYLLIRDLTGSPLASFAGAAIYTYANDQMVIGTIAGTENYLMGTAFLSLYCVFLLRASNAQRWGRYAVAAVGVLLALALTDWQYTLFAVLFTVLFVVVMTVLRRDVRAAGALLLRCGMIGVTWAIIVLPTLVLPMLREARLAPWLSFGNQARNYAKALSEFVHPGYKNPGYLVLMVIAVGLVMLWRRADLRADRAVVGFWAVVAAFGFIFSLGPRLHVRPDHETTIPLPYLIATRLPLLSVSRKPFLFYTSFAMLGTGVLLAFALRTLLPVIPRWIAARMRIAFTPRVTRIVSGACVTVVLIGSLLPGLVVTRDGRFAPPDWPPFYRDMLAKDPDTYAILETPLFLRQRGRSDAVYQAFQIVHQKYRFGSSLARDHKAENPELFVRRATLFRDFFDVNRPIIERYRPTSTADFLDAPDYRAIGVPLLNFYHVRYIVLYLDALDQGSPPGIGIARNLVQHVLGVDARPVYADAEMEAYRVPDAPPLSQPVFIDTGSTGWWRVEATPAGVPYRWADTRGGKPAELVLFNLSDQPRTARVQCTLFNYHAARDVQITLNGNAVDGFNFAPDAAREMTLDLTLPPGMSALRLSSPQPPIPVVGGGDDPRLLSFGVRDVRVQEIRG